MTCTPTSTAESITSPASSVAANNYAAAKGAVTAAMRQEPALDRVKAAAVAVSNPFYTPKN
jgi:formaldehyde-activating enzyme involved in methanogenesis